MHTSRVSKTTAPRCASPADLCAALQRHGPLAVRAGQLLALRRDELPRPFCDALLRMDGRIDPLPWSKVRAILAEDLAAGPEIRSAQIDPIPIASGPLAQAHRACLGDGTPVLVKIQRPGLRELVERDPAAQGWPALLVDGNVPLAAPAAEVVEELVGCLRRELDLPGELARLERMHQLTLDDPNQETPRPYRPLSGPRILTTDDLPGLSALEMVRRPPHVDPPDGDRNRFAASLLRAVLAQVGDYRFLQPDVHPANLLATPPGRVRFASYGLCIELSPATRDAEVRYLAAVYHEDLDEVLKAALGLLAPGDRTALAEFRRSFQAEVASWSGGLVDDERAANGAARSERSSSVPNLEGVLRLARRHALEIPAGVVATHRAVIAAELVAAQGSADVDLRSIGRDYFDDLRGRDALRALRPENLRRTLVSLGTLLNDAPRDLVEILSLLSDDRFDLGLNVSDMRRDALADERRVRLVVTALACLAVSLLLASPRSPTLFGISATWPLVGVLLGLLVWLGVQWKQLS